MSTLLQDLRYGLRTLWLSRGFAALAVIMLALGIGANTAIFSVVNAMLLRKLPFPQSDRLVFVFASQPKMNLIEAPTSIPDYLDWKNQARSFSALGLYAQHDETLTGGGQPERVPAAQITASLFALLGVQPLRGRLFREDEERTPVAILGHKLWARRFASNPQILGQSILLGGKPHTVIGIMPKWFDFSDGQELWVPLHPVGEDKARGQHNVIAAGRLAPGSTIAQAQVEMTGITATLADKYKDTNEGWTALVRSMHETFVEDDRKLLLTLSGAVAFVLLIVCANVANLLLARAAGRQREIAIRAALGATQPRMIRQLLTESLLLALAGGTLGIPLAFWCVGALREQAEGLQYSFLRVDSEALVFTLAISMVTGLLFGLAPAWTTARTDLTEALKQGGKGSAGGRRKLKNTFVVAQVALSLVLLAGAGLMMRSFVLIRAISPGFDTRELLTARVALPEQRYTTYEQCAIFARRLNDRLTALPGARSAAVTTSLPFHAGEEGGSGVFVAGRPPVSLNDVPILYKRFITPEYPHTLGIRLKRGRLFTEADGEKAPAVVIINETAARKLFPSEDAIGQRLGFDTNTKPADFLTVVGVVSDTRDIGLTVLPRPTMYIPYGQQRQHKSRMNFFSLAIRAERDADKLTSGVRAALAALDPDLPLFEIETMQKSIANSTSDQRQGMLLFSSFGALALLLASLGIYGVMAYTVAQRTNEIGVRIALGASRGNVLWLVLSESAKVLVVGVALGLAGAFALTRVLEEQLYNVKATDPVTFVTVPVMLIAVALAASYIPARRATRVDPTVALRYE
jgi:putative ABC transport system permease protein